MFIQNLLLQKFRNFDLKEFEFPSGTVVFEGRNGTGKSNILEAIYCLCTGKSQRRAKHKEMINFDNDFFL